MRVGLFLVATGLLAACETVIVAPGGAGPDAAGGVVVGPDAAGEGCRDFGTYSEPDGTMHRYLLSSSPTGWTAAEVICRNAGGHLVVLDSVAEAEFLSNIAKEAGLEPPYWIGARRLEPVFGPCPVLGGCSADVTESGFEWITVDDGAVSCAPSQGDSEAWGWATGEPDACEPGAINANGGANCMAQDTRGWTDRDCMMARLTSICECDGKPVGVLP